MRAGAYDFVTKPVEIDALAIAVGAPPSTASCAGR